MNQVLFTVCILGFLTLHVDAQQNYSSNAAGSCVHEGPPTDFLYTCNDKNQSCNDKNQSCQAFLIFLSQPSYNSVDSISSLTSSIPHALASFNNVHRKAVFPTNKEVIVPVLCSCEGQYFWSNVSYILKRDESYTTVANVTFQGLSTCNALRLVNPYDALRLEPGMILQVPLRCACPTAHQAADGTKYLLTYWVNGEDHISDIAKRFSVSETSILEANNLPEENPVISSFTTILIPLQAEPSGSETITRPQKPVMASSKRKLFVGLAVTVVLLVLAVTAVYLSYKKRSGGFHQRVGNKKTEKESGEDLRVEIANFEEVLVVFGFEEIKEATENFSARNRLKSSVYRGVFGGKTLAVKEMNRDAPKEVKVLQKIKHFNLIKLEGVCEKNGCYYLLFEYMQNGSLREWLSGNVSKDRKCWSKRIQIALDVANGLHYLHNFIEPPYVHMDINSDNVLLTSDLRAKIANFRLARTAKTETTDADLTIHVIGTTGYMAPEYQKTGQVTPKVDVYAFGVIMLELITGKEAIIKQDDKKVELSAAIASIMEGNNPKPELSLFLDPTLEGNEGTELVLRIAKLSVACLTQDPARRPSMWEVVSSLLKIQADFDGTEPFNMCSPAS